MSRNIITWLEFGNRYGFKLFGKSFVRIFLHMSHHFRHFTTFVPFFVHHSFFVGSSIFSIRRNFTRNYLTFFLVKFQFIFRRSNTITIGSPVKILSSKLIGFRIETTVLELMNIWHFWSIMVGSWKHWVEEGFVLLEIEGNDSVFSFEESVGKWAEILHYLILLYIINFIIIFYPQNFWF